MTRRFEILCLLLVLAVTSGCAATSRRGDGMALLGGGPWGDAPAPPQRVVAASTVSSGSVLDASGRPSGLARYFPGLQRESTEVTKVTSAGPRFNWFGLRPAKVATTTTYMTDARQQLNRQGSEPVVLPVALQVPSGRATRDQLVTTTNAEAPGVDRDSGTASLLDNAGGDKTSMPKVPAVDPLDDLKLGKTESNSGDSSPPDAQAIKASNGSAEPAQPPAADEAKPAADQAKPQAAAQIVETMKVSGQTNQPLASPQGPPPRPTDQVVPTSQAKPTPQAKPSSQICPTSQARPTPQVEAGSTCDAKSAKKPCCIKRLMAKLFKSGDSACPPATCSH